MFTYMAGNFNVVAHGSGEYGDTPSCLRDANFDHQTAENVQFIRKMESEQTSRYGMPMYMVKRVGSKFAFCSDPNSATHPGIDEVLASAKKARMAAEEKNKVAMKVTCWNCGKRFSENIKVCNRCSKARYCSGNCQQAHWAKHIAKCPVWKAEKKKKKNKKIKKDENKEPAPQA
jgi:hypothetical protein